MYQKCRLARRTILEHNMCIIYVLVMIRRREFMPLAEVVVEVTFKISFNSKCLFSIYRSCNIDSYKSFRNCFSTFYLRVKILLK